MTGSGDTATLRMRGAPHAEPKIHGGDRKGETQHFTFSWICETMSLKSDHAQLILTEE